jgi:UDP-glucose 4-epimerase
MKDITGQRVLILGGSGFIGTHLWKRLKGEVLDLKVLSRTISREQKLIDGVTWIEADMRDHAVLASAMERVDTVYHLVNSGTPMSSNIDRLGDIQSNLLPTIEMMDIAVSAGVKKIVFISSGGTVYGVPRSIPTAEDDSTEPITSYGIVKLTLEKYLQLYNQLFGIKVAIIRAANPYGPGQLGNRNQGFIGALLASYFYGKPMDIWGDGTVIRDFIYVDDLVEAIVLSGASSEDLLRLNIGGGQGTSLIQVIAAVEEIIEGTLAVEFRPARKSDIPNSTLNINMAKLKIGWEPTTTLKTGIEKTMNWFEQERKRLG